MVNAIFIILKGACRDDEDNFYDRTEGGPRQKRAAQPEALDAATLLGQKVFLLFLLCDYAVLCCAVSAEHSSSAVTA